MSNLREENYHRSTNCQIENDQNKKATRLSSINKFIKNKIQYVRSLSIDRGKKKIFENKEHNCADKLTSLLKPEVLKHLTELLNSPNIEAIKILLPYILNDDYDQEKLFQKLLELKDHNLVNQNIYAQEKNPHKNGYTCGDGPHLKSLSTLQKETKERPNKFTKNCIHLHPSSRPNLENRSRFAKFNGIRKILFTKGNTSEANISVNKRASLIMVNLECDSCWDKLTNCATSLNEYRNLVAQSPSFNSCSSKKQYQSLLKLVDPRLEFSYNETTEPEPSNRNNNNRPSIRIKICDDSDSKSSSRPMTKVTNRISENLIQKYESTKQIASKNLEKELTNLHIEHESTTDRSDSTLDDNSMLTSYQEDYDNLLLMNYNRRNEAIPVSSESNSRVDLLPTNKKYVYKRQQRKLIRNLGDSPINRALKTNQNDLERRISSSFQTIKTNTDDDLSNARVKRCEKLRKSNVSLISNKQKD